MKGYLTSCLPLDTKWGIHGVVAENSSRTQKDPISFDGACLRAIIDAFVVTLTTHVSNPSVYYPVRNLRSHHKFKLQAEVTYLNPENIKVSGMTEPQLEEIDGAVMAHVRTLVHKTRPASSYVAQFQN